MNQTNRQILGLCIGKLHALAEAKNTKEDRDERTWAEAQASMAFQVAGTIGIDPNKLRAIARQDRPFERSGSVMPTRCPHIGYGTPSYAFPGERGVTSRLWSKTQETPS